MVDKVTQETKDKIELRRSRVRQVVTYIFAVTGAIIILWGLMWMGDRSLATAGLTIVTALVSFWFGERSAEKKQ